MKPPLTYYGGKQKMLKEILPLIPKHKLYCEPFFGGGAVFFGKEPSDVEVINDTNGMLINFYNVLKNDFKGLQKEIKATLYSRELHKYAKVILKHPKLFSPTKQAWAVWVLANQSFASQLNGSWGYSRKEATSEVSLDYKRKNFESIYANRLEKVQIECRDAIDVIKSRDSLNTFFYVDPPYVGTNLAHYKGYSEKDFEKLLICLSKIKGKFILSTYPNKMLNTFLNKYNWRKLAIKKSLCVSESRKNKVELLVRNFMSP